MGANYNNHQSPKSTLRRIPFSRGFLIGMILITALVSFEIFNFSTTDFALSDLLGNLTFLGLPWATILAIAFCGIDFAGIARLNTPEAGSGRANETWYLFGAWLLAATMIAILTWWRVALALVSHDSLGNSVVDAYYVDNQLESSGLSCSRTLGTTPISAKSQATSPRSFNPSQNQVKILPKVQAGLRFLMGMAQIAHGRSEDLGDKYHSLTFKFFTV